MMPGNDMNVFSNAKKLPNPANYKIVKCKNYEKGKKNLFILKIKKKFILKNIFYFFKRWFL